MADRIASLVAEWTRAKAGALEFVEAMPENLIGFKPVPEIFSFSEQMVHIAKTTYFFAKGVGSIEAPADMPDKERSKAELLEFVGGSYDFMIRAIQSVKAEALDEDVQFHKWAMPLGVMIGKALEHHAHHRGQTAIYFRLNGLKPPSEKLF